jgi:hypothetical protein
MNSKSLREAKSGTFERPFAERERVDSLMSEQTVVIEFLTVSDSDREGDPIRVKLESRSDLAESEIKALINIRDLDKN